MFKDIHAVGLDLGSSYVKAIFLDRDRMPVKMVFEKTGVDFKPVVSSLLAGVDGDEPVFGVTGYGRRQWPGLVRKTEIAALERGMAHHGFPNGTLVDIGGQDSKVMVFEAGKMVHHTMNRRCAAGTGSYLEYMGFRLGLEASAMNNLAAREPNHHPLNSFCTVFAGTEILDCIGKNVPLPRVVRGIYFSIVERVREMAALEPPVFLSGGVIAHHPVLLEAFQEVLGKKTNLRPVPDPQFLAALGIALLATERNHEERSSN